METIEEFFKNRILVNEVNRSYRCINYISNGLNRKFSITFFFLKMQHFLTICSVK